MIKRKEIQNFAEALGVPANTIDKDYVIGHFLNELFSMKWAQKAFVFKGGTCLKKCYFENYRFSEDIDITVSESNFILTKNMIQDICDSVTQKTEIAFKIMSFESIYSDDILMGWDYKVCFWGANHLNEPPNFSSNCHTSLEFDVRTHEIQLDKSEIRKIFHPYSDKKNITNNIPCYSIEEILAEKIRSLLQRKWGEARDYYDLWYIKNNISDINWDNVKNLFYQKCKFKQVTFESSDDFFFKERLNQVKETWEKRLTHQLPKGILVECDLVINELKLFFKSIF